MRQCDWTFSERIENNNYYELCVQFSSVLAIEWALMWAISMISVTDNTSTMEHYWTSEPQWKQLSNWRPDGHKFWRYDRTASEFGAVLIGRKTQILHTSSAFDALVGEIPLEFPKKFFCIRNRAIERRCLRDDVLTVLIKRSFVMDRQTEGRRATAYTEQA